MEWEEIRTTPLASRLLVSRSVPLRPSSRVTMSVAVVGILGSAWLQLVSVDYYVTWRFTLTLATAKKTVVTKPRESFILATVLTCLCEMSVGNVDASHVKHEGSARLFKKVYIPFLSLSILLPRL